MLYWNLERELVEGEPLFFGQNKQLQYLNPSQSTRDKIYSEIFHKTELKKVSSVQDRSKNI